MHKREYIILSLLIITIAFIVFLLWRLQYNSNQQPPINTQITQKASLSPWPTVTPIPTEKNKINIFSSSPPNLAKDISVDTGIIIEFDKNITSNDVAFSIFPNITYDTFFSENKIIIRPKEKLNSGTLYSYQLRYPSNNEFIHSFSFTTSGPTPTKLPDTRSETSYQQTEQFYLKNHPDIFLTNKIPYSTEYFTITSQLINEPFEHFKFTVILFGDKQKSQTEFEIWLVELGLEQIQINNLDINYE